MLKQEFTMALGIILAGVLVALFVFMGQMSANVVAVLFALVMLGSLGVLVYFWIEVRRERRQR
jgi:hypothetical protein